MIIIIITIIYVALIPFSSLALYTRMKNTRILRVDKIKKNNFKKRI